MSLWLVLVALQSVGGFEAARDAPLTPGEWRYITSAGGSEAQFVGGFTIRCDRATRQVQLTRVQPRTSPSAGMPSIHTDTMAVQFASGGWLPASNVLLDAIAYSRGRFVVSGGGGARLVIPAAPEAARSIEDCRN